MSRVARALVMLPGYEREPGAADDGAVEEDVPVVTEESRSEPEAGAHVQSSPRVPLERSLVRCCRRRRRVPGPLVELGDSGMVSYLSVFVTMRGHIEIFVNCMGCKYYSLLVYEPAEASRRDPKERRRARGWWQTSSCRGQC